MKIAATIARYLLGVIFLVFGLNQLSYFIPNRPIPPEPTGQFIERPDGVALYLGRWTSSRSCLGFCCLSTAMFRWRSRFSAPVIVNICLSHILMAPSALPLAA